jgi:hypothetical protein
MMGKYPAFRRLAGQRRRTLGPESESGRESAARESFLRRGDLQYSVILRRVLLRVVLARRCERARLQKKTEKRKEQNPKRTQCSVKESRESRDVIEVEQKTETSLAFETR